MSNQHATVEDHDSTADASPATQVDELTARIEVLQEENRRLRQEYVRAQQTEYRRAAIGLALLGAVAGLGGLVFPDVRATLFALAGIGLFTAVLTYYITPNQVITATVGERTYTTYATVGAELIGELGLQEDAVFVPTPTGRDPTTGAPVTLFLPQHASYTIPDAEALSSLFVVPEDEQAHGIALPPTGALLLQEFQESMTETLATTPTELTAQVTDALVDGFELIDAAVPQDDIADATVTIGVRASTFGALDRFDHPVPSFVGAAFAAGLDTPTEVTVTATDDDRFDYLLTCSWEATDGA